MILLWVEDLRRKMELWAMSKLISYLVKEVTTCREWIGWAGSQTKAEVWQCPGTWALLFLNPCCLPLPLNLPKEGSGCLEPEEMSQVMSGASLGKCDWDEENARTWKVAAYLGQSASRTGGWTVKYTGPAGPGKDPQPGRGSLQMTEVCNAETPWSKEALKEK